MFDLIVTSNCYPISRVVARYFGPSTASVVAKAETLYVSSPVDVDANKSKPRFACLSSVATTGVVADTNIFGVVVVAATDVDSSKPSNAIDLDAVAPEESPIAAFLTGPRVKPMDNKLRHALVGI